MKAEDIEKLFHTFYLEKLKHEKNQDNSEIKKDEFFSLDDGKREKEKNILLYPELILQ